MIKIELLKKLKEDRCTDAELQQIYHWLVSAKEEDEVTDFFKNTWQEASSDNGSYEDSISVSRMKAEIWSRISSEPSATYPNNRVDKRKTFYYSGLKIAAVLTLLVCAGLMLWIVKNESDPVGLVTQASQITKFNPRGQKSTVFLRDGSKVILNSSSSIEYDSNFGEKNRDIILKGEAFFEVAKNKELPFNVTTGKITTTALGTSFNIKAYPENAMKISLVTGKTKIALNGVKGNDEQSYFLKPGQSIKFDPVSDHFTKDSFNAKEILSWKEGVIYFENESFDEVKRVLEEWYDVSISVDYGAVDLSKYNGIHGEFQNQSLQNVLKIMSHSRNFDYQLKGKKLSIQFKKE
ncbi:MAG: FecR domain-containing protein [Reichenbachiella sp.]|uniref:FecR family protein n=1 Tax=Reichenbachiella sp. TaxID=2184521 RepID=UPI003267142F